MRWITTVALSAAVAGGITFGLGQVYLHRVAETAPAQAQQVQEDDPSWDCRTDGNRICGPDNVQDVQPGCYSDAGTLVAPWPCHIVVGPDGEADVYAP